MMRNFGNEGRTVLFATHHLAEADEIADRVIVLNHGKVVADGPGATLKAAVATRRVRFVTDRPDRAEFRSSRASQRSTSAGQACRSTHLMLTPLSATWSAVTSQFRDLEITGAGLEQAFVALTGCGAGVAPGQVGARNGERPPIPRVVPTGDRTFDRSTTGLSDHRSGARLSGPHTTRRLAAPRVTPLLAFGRFEVGRLLPELEVSRHHRWVSGGLLYPLPGRSHRGQGG